MTERFTLAKLGEKPERSAYGEYVESVRRKLWDTYLLPNYGLTEEDIRRAQSHADTFNPRKA